MRHEYQLCSYRAHHYEQHLCICLSRDPTELPEQVIGLNKFMHLLYLCIFFLCIWISWHRYIQQQQQEGLPTLSTYCN
ncbi:hypothetical protein PR202_gb28856 [Eleusine coracana subsp. coracana]|uniref:Uncharacterized protein n=1 Tax=Eleusine coracana subsp. coracana TaxID=191504 RepID=A0AAV5FYS1_ELECO|nr:hypothetical protein PR202_gb28856 [Eleusine coracana subsp. coracana]